MEGKCARLPMSSWRDLPPVSEDEQPDLPADWTPSQTFLRTHDKCDRAALLYLIHGGGAASHELNRGSVVHETVERLLRMLVEQNEPKVPPEIARDVLYEVMADNPEMQISAEERDSARYMVDHWARGTSWEPEKILGIEKTLTLETGGFRVLVRPDLLTEPAPKVLRVHDVKTAWPPDSEEFRAQAYDANGNPRFAGNYQLILGAIIAVFGITDDGLPLGDYERVQLVLEFPRILREDGIDKREIEVDRLQLQSYRDDLDLQLRRLREVCLDKRKWQPTPGNHCAECTAEVACPLPRVLRPESQMADVKTSDDIAEAATRWHFMTRSSARLKRRVKKAAESLPPEQLETFVIDGDEVQGIRIGKDIALVFADVEKQEIADRENLLAAAEAAANLGEPFNRDDHVKRRQSVEFVKRRVAPQ